jgi:hypothetical protein
MKFAGAGPTAEKFLIERIRPIVWDEQVYQQTLKNLNSDDDSVVKAAVDEMQFFEPRLYGNLGNLLDKIDDKRTRNRMIFALSKNNSDEVDIHILDKCSYFVVDNGTDIAISFIDSNGKEVYSRQLANSIKQLTNFGLGIYNLQWYRQDVAIQALVFFNRSRYQEAPIGLLRPSPGMLHSVGKTDVAILDA